MNFLKSRKIWSSDRGLQSERSQNKMAAVSGNIYWNGKNMFLFWRNKTIYMKNIIYRTIKWILELQTVLLLLFTGIFNLLDRLFQYFFLICRYISI